MKKFFAVFAVIALLAVPITASRAEAREEVVSLLLSAGLPGVGEWYNSGFSGNYPLAECILGYVCPCVWISSVVDAVDGKSNEKIRFDFWTAP
jgi:hypothetical protein